MYGRILNTVINIMFITYLLLLVSFYFLHEGIRENINNINGSTIDAIAISGQLSEEIYNNLKEKVLSYNANGCNYEMTIKFEKKLKMGVFDTYYIKDVIIPGNAGYAQDMDGDGDIDDEDYTLKDPGRIVTTLTNKYPMNKGDRITIYLEDKNQTLYGKLISAPFLGMLSSTKKFNITSLKSTIIGRDADSLVNGLEVIQEINDTTRNYGMTLVTELGPVQYTFLPGIQYVETNALFAASAVDPVSGKIEIGQYHIFSNGTYSRTWEDSNSNGKLDAGDIVRIYQTIK